MTHAVGALPEKPKVALLAGKGDLSGVPRYIKQLSAALEEMAAITVVSDFNTGGYSFLRGSKYQYIEIEGLRTCLRPVLVYQAWKKLSKLLEKHSFHIVAAHARTPALLLRLFTIKCTFLHRHVPIPVVTYHGLPFAVGHRWGIRALSLALEWIMVRLSPPHFLIFLTAAARTDFIAKIGVNACRRHMLLTQTNCSNLGHLPATARRGTNRTIVMTGRAGYQKNLGAAIALFSELPPNYRLVLCGPGTDTLAFRTAALRITSDEVVSRVEFIGPVADVRPFLAAADCYLLTSRYEGLSIGAIEAFEAGLPLALSAVAGNSEIQACHPFAVTLRLRDFVSDAAQLHRHISAYLDDRDALQIKIQAAWQRTHSYKHWKRDVQTLYWCTISPNCGPPRYDWQLQFNIDKLTTRNISAKQL